MTGIRQSAVTSPHPSPRASLPGPGPPTRTCEYSTHDDGIAAQRHHSQPCTPKHPVSFFATASHGDAVGWRRLPAATAAANAATARTTLLTLAMGASACESESAGW